MNTFQKKLKDVKDSVMDLEKRSRDNTNLLLSLMKISDKDLGNAEEHEVVWEVGNYVLVPVHRIRKQYGWVNELEVLPNYIYNEVGKSSVGWSNITHSKFPKGWEYYPHGTGTLLIPPKEIIEEVSKLISEKVNREYMEDLSNKIAEKEGYIEDRIRKLKDLYITRFKN